MFLLCWQLWNLDNGVPLTPRVASAATFEHLIKDDFRADAPSVLPKPWGYTRGEGRHKPEGSPVSAISRLMVNLDYLDSGIPDWKDEHE